MPFDNESDRPVYIKFNGREREREIVRYGKRVSETTFVFPVSNELPLRLYVYESKIALMVKIDKI